MIITHPSDKLLKLVNYVPVIKIISPGKSLDDIRKPNRSLPSLDSISQAKYLSSDIV